MLAIVVSKYFGFAVSVVYPCWWVSCVQSFWVVFWYSFQRSLQPQMCLSELGRSWDPLCWGSNKKFRTSGPSYAAQRLLAPIWCLLDQTPLFFALLRDRSYITHKQKFWFGWHSSTNKNNKCKKDYKRNLKNGTPSEYSNPAHKVCIVSLPLHISLV